MIQIQIGVLSRIRQQHFHDSFNIQQFIKTLKIQYFIISSQLNKSFWMKLAYNSTALRQTQIYQLYQGQNNAKQKFFAHMFPRAKLQTYGIDQTIEHNISSFQQSKDSIFPQAFLSVYQMQTHNQYYKIVSEPYTQNLLQYLANKQLNQGQALQIFSSVLKAVYSLILIGVKPVNVRPQHFVKVKNKWKLRTLVLNSDTSKSKGISSQYVWDPKYQAPQQYLNNGKNQLQDEDLKLVVWNLGSILLDLLISGHFLKTQQVIKSFANKEFTFDLIKGKKKEKISPQIKSFVCKMLHYNPKQRIVIQKLFQSQQLSKQVHQHFQKVADGKSDISIGELQLKMTQKLSQSIKGSLLKSKSNKSKIIQKTQEPPKQFKQKLQKIVEQQNEMKQIMSNKDTQILDDDFIMNSLDLISNRIKKNQKKHVTFSQNIVTTQIISNQESQILPKEQSFFQNQKFRKLFQIYKTYLDRSELLFVTSHKFNQIPFYSQADQIILLSKYAVYFVGLMNLNNIVLSINHNKNIYKIQNSLFNQFIQSIQYKSFKMYVGSIFQKKQTIFQRLSLQLEDFDVKKQNLLKSKQIQEFVFQSNFRSKQFNEVKTPFRKILKKSYDSITKHYNTKKQQGLGRLGMYVVCCMTVDKLYQQNDIEKNFSLFFEWMNKAPSKYVSISYFQKYLDQANVTILIKHARYILETYFNV